MMEYNGFLFGVIRGNWCLVYPSGLKTFPPNLKTDADVKALIDQITAQFEGK